MSWARLAFWLPRLALAVGFALIASHWFWRLGTSDSLALIADRLETDPRHLATQLVAANLFGGSGDTGTMRSRMAEEEFRLVGVAAGSGVALIASADRSVEAFRVGAEIIPGKRLVKVAPRHVELESAGQRQVLKLPDDKWKK